VNFTESLILDLDEPSIQSDPASDNESELYLDQNNEADSIEMDYLEPPDVFFDAPEYQPFFEEPSLDESATSSLTDDLLTFLLLFNISTRAMNFLLSILIKHGISVPPSLYLLKKCIDVPNFARTVCKNGAEMVYFSIKENFKFCIDKHIIVRSCTLDMHFNIDGLPIYRSSSVSAWPILLKIPQIHLSYPLPVAIYVGKTKPVLHELIRQLFDELVDYIKNGFNYNGVYIQLGKILFICDAPARAMLQNVSYHTSKVGCPYCRIQGSTVEGRVVFDGFSEMRTDQSYRAGEENNQVGPTPLSSLPNIGLRSSFPPEYQHLVCLGVVRRLSHFFFSSVKDFKLTCRLSQNQILQVNDLIKYSVVHFPCEFNRKMRPVDELQHFKAAEFRNFILYFAPFILHKFLPQKYFNHLMCLHFSIYVFSDTIHKSLWPNAHDLITHFVDTCSDLFTSKVMVYNFHVLRHLSEFVNLYGPLESWSTFYFENYLGVLKRRTACTPHILSHVSNNMIKIRDLTTSRESSLFYSTQPPNNYCVYSAGLLLITSISGGTVSGKKLEFVKDLYIFPYPSSVLSIGYYKVSTQDVCNVQALNKCVCIPFENNSLVIPYACSHYYS
jgi:hypothetical protein